MAPGSLLKRETPEQIFLRVFIELKPRTPPPAIRVEFCAFANANSFIRLERGALFVRITDVLHGAPAGVLEALAHILLGKLIRRPAGSAYVDRYRRHLNSKATRTSLHSVRRERGRKLLLPALGERYDLETLFEDLNFRFFGGLMSRPVLGWSRGASRSALGHYDPSHNAIVLSRALDRESVPRIAVEYVMFHEMLHLRHPVEHKAARRCVHTPEFKRAEAEFPQLHEAKQLLKAL